MIDETAVSEANCDRESWKKMAYKARLAVERSEGVAVKLYGGAGSCPGCGSNVLLLLAVGSELDEPINLTQAFLAPK